ncbi:MAG: hypothetical protein ABIG92_05835 [Candidatus Omnitrophota bacterium]
MNVIYITMFALVILLGFEVRYRLMAEKMDILNSEFGKLKKDIVRLNAEIKLKQDMYQENKPK